MSRSLPDVEDYVRLFQIYGQDLGSIYTVESETDPYLLLFEQVILLLIRPSGFNFSLPDAFRTTAQRYHRGEPSTTERFADPDTRHFMLCDLHDIVMLQGGLQFKRRLENGDE